LEPDKPLPWQNRAACHRELEHWPEAADDLARAVALGAEGHRPWYELALCRAAAENAEGYREACRSMIEQLGKTDDPLAAEFVAWSCALAPEALETLELPISLAQQAAKQNGDDPSSLTCIGAILYRAGRVEEAIAQLNRAAQLMGDSAEGARASPAYSWYFLALAHKKTGNEEQAREYLSKANQWRDDALADKDNPPAWNRRVALELLRKEAEALVGTDDQQSAASGQKPERESNTETPVGGDEEPD